MFHTLHPRRNFIPHRLTKAVLFLVCYIISAVNNPAIIGIFIIVIIS